MMLLLGGNSGSISTWQTKELEGADIAFADIDMRYLYIEQYLYQILLEYELVMRHYFLYLF